MEEGIRTFVPQLHISAQLLYQNMDGICVTFPCGQMEGGSAIPIPYVNNSAQLIYQCADSFRVTIRCGRVEGAIAMFGPHVDNSAQLVHQNTDGICVIIRCGPMERGVAIIILNIKPHANSGAPPFSFTKPSPAPSAKTSAAALRPSVAAKCLEVFSSLFIVSLALGIPSVYKGGFYFCFRDAVVDCSLKMVRVDDTDKIYSG